MQLQIKGDPEIARRIAQYEMAFRMQTSVPELIDVSKEPKHVLDMYGPDVKQPGTFAYNCLLARRLAERGVRSCRSSTAAGTITAVCRATSGSQCRRHRPAVGRLVQI